MISPLTIALLAAGCCMAFAENSVFYRETPLACRIKCKLVAVTYVYQKLVPYDLVRTLNSNPVC